MTTPHLKSLAAGLLLAATAAAHAAPPAEIIIPGERITPESLTSAKDGSVIFGSIGTQQIFRARPGAATAEPWIVAGTDGIGAVFGVFADDKSGTLYACSNTFGPPRGGPPAPGTTPPPPPPAQLYTFDLKSGTPKGHYAFPTPGSFCNDIAVGPDGTAYATDTNNNQVVALKKGAKELTAWTTVNAFGEKAGLDGVAVLGKRVITGTISTSKLFAVPIQPDGSAGTVTELKLDQPVQQPDGVRSFGGDTLLVVEQGPRTPPGQPSQGRLSKVKVSGDTATVTPIKQAYPDGPVAVTVVGTTAYVVEAQFGAMMRPPGAPAAEAKPYHATAVEVGKAK